MKTNISKLALTATLLLAAALIFSCTDSGGGEPGVSGSSVIDEDEDSSSSETDEPCNGVSYDPDTYRCEYGELIGKCKGVDYYINYERCVDGVVIDDGGVVIVISSSSVARSSSSNNISYISSSSINASSSSLLVSSSSIARSSSSINSNPNPVVPSSSSNNEPGNLIISGCPYTTTSSNALDVHAMSTNPVSVSIYLSTASTAAGSGIMRTSNTVTWTGTKVPNGTFTIVISLLLSGDMAFFKATGVTLANGSGTVAWTKFSRFD